MKITNSTKNSLKINIRKITFVMIAFTYIILNSSLFTQQNRVFHFKTKEKELKKVIDRTSSSRNLGFSDEIKLKLDINKATELNDSFIPISSLTICYWMRISIPSTEEGDAVNNNNNYWLSILSILTNQQLISFSENIYTYGGNTTEQNCLNSFGCIASIISNNKFSKFEAFKGQSQIVFPLNYRENKFKQYCIMLIRNNLEYSFDNDQNKSKIVIPKQTDNLYLNVARYLVEPNADNIISTKNLSLVFNISYSSIRNIELISNMHPEDYKLILQSNNNYLPYYSKDVLDFKYDINGYPQIIGKEDIIEKSSLDNLTLSHISPDLSLKSILPESAKIYIINNITSLNIKNLLKFIPNYPMATNSNYEKVSYETISILNYNADYLDNFDTIQKNLTFTLRAINKHISINPIFNNNDFLILQTTYNELGSKLPADIVKMLLPENVDLSQKTYVDLYKPFLALKELTSYNFLVLDAYLKPTAQSYTYLDKIPISTSIIPNFFRHFPKKYIVNYNNKNLYYSLKNKSQSTIFTNIIVKNGVSISPTEGIIVGFTINDKTIDEITTTVKLNPTLTTINLFKFEVSKYTLNMYFNNKQNLIYLDLKVIGSEYGTQFIISNNVRDIVKTPYVPIFKSSINFTIIFRMTRTSLLITITKNYSKNNGLLYGTDAIRYSYEFTAYKLADLEKITLNEVFYITNPFIYKLKNIATYNDFMQVLQFHNLLPSEASLMFSHLIEDYSSCFYLTDIKESITSININLSSKLDSTTKIDLVLDQMAAEIYSHPLYSELASINSITEENWKISSIFAQGYPKIILVNLETAISKQNNVDDDDKDDEDEDVNINISNINQFKILIKVKLDGIFMYNYFPNQITIKLTLNGKTKILTTEKLMQGLEDERTFLIEVKDTDTSIQLTSEVGDANFQTQIITYELISFINDKKVKDLETIYDFNKLTNVNYDLNSILLDYDVNSQSKFSPYPFALLNKFSYFDKIMVYDSSPLISLLENKQLVQKYDSGVLNLNKFAKFNPSKYSSSCLDYQLSWTSNLQGTVNSFSPKTFNIFDFTKIFLTSLYPINLHYDVVITSTAVNLLGVTIETDNNFDGFVQINQSSFTVITDKNVVNSVNNKIKLYTSIDYDSKIGSDPTIILKIINNNYFKSNGELSSSTEYRIMNYKFDYTNTDGIILNLDGSFLENTQDSFKILCYAEFKYVENNFSVSELTFSNLESNAYFVKVKVNGKNSILVYLEKIVLYNYTSNDFRVLNVLNSVLYPNYLTGINIDLTNFNYQSNFPNPELKEFFNRVLFHTTSSQVLSLGNLAYSSSFGVSVNEKFNYTFEIINLNQLYTIDASFEDDKLVKTALEEVSKTSTDPNTCSKQPLLIISNARKIVGPKKLDKKFFESSEFSLSFSIFETYFILVFNPICFTKPIKVVYDSINSEVLSQQILNIYRDNKEPNVVFIHTKNFEKIEIFSSSNEKLFTLNRELLEFNGKNIDQSTINSTKTIYNLEDINDKEINLNLNFPTTSLLETIELDKKTRTTFKCLYTATDLKTNASLK